jgi:hypothetical protein
MSMLRTAVCTALAFVVFASAGLSGDADARKQNKGKKKAGESGQIVKLDAEKGILTVKMTGRKKQPGPEKEYKITEKTAVTVMVKADKVADLLKVEPFKAGANVRVETEEDGTTAKAITIGGPEAKKKKKKKDA